jgi:hypothetical protein
LKNRLELRYFLDVKKYETYVVSGISSKELEFEDKCKIFIKEGFKYIESFSVDECIFYSCYQSNYRKSQEDLKEYTYLDTSTSSIDNDMPTFFKLNIKKPQEPQEIIKESSISIHSNTTEVINPVYGKVVLEYYSNPIKLDEDENHEEEIDLSPIKLSPIIKERYFNISPTSSKSDKTDSESEQWEHII